MKKRKKNKCKICEKAKISCAYCATKPQNTKAAEFFLNKIGEKEEK